MHSDWDDDWDDIPDEWYDCDDEVNHRSLVLLLEMCFSKPSAIKGEPKNKLD